MVGRDLHPRAACGPETGRQSDPPSPVPHWSSSARPARASSARRRALDGSADQDAPDDRGESKGWAPAG